ncbi:Crp/Fnr family transcriptional regulator [Guptibacillus hwajinpoensis]|uniref:Crp/Fnr family transcriptional regulator n=1 Tax=Guptibacillus hwajinpoensis TaxID=208199 RepID=UPI00273F3428|nr:cyclic nucleotide-binding domain-containing protein [Pseudalkalibacillus hwajinpoensis]WLR61194.1 cyclic nucleotide-binding domain-containing protein [Pseudalkalibacillus hwajinpoensis]
MSTGLVVRNEGSKLNMKDWNRLERSGQLIKRNNGRFLIKPEHTNRDVYIIKSGSIAIYHADNMNESLAVLGTNDVLGNRSIFVHQNLYAKTITNVELIQLDQTSYRALYLAYPELAIKLTTELSRLKLIIDFPERTATSFVKQVKNGFQNLINKNTSKKGRYCHNC